MSKTDKDNKHQPKHSKRYSCIENDCIWCKAKAKENRKTREDKARKYNID